MTEPVPPLPPSQVPASWALGAGLAAFLVYLAVAPHAPAGGDSSEFTLMLAVDGVPHPTGYPLYTMLGHVFVRIAHGLGAGWPYAANAWSALGAGAGIALFCGLAARLVPADSGASRVTRFIVALVPTWLLALNPVWLRQATTAEVHAWQGAIVCTAAAVAWRALEALAADPPPDTRRVFAGAAGWGLVCGAGLAHHVTSVFVLLPLTLALALAVTRARAWSARLVGAAVVGTVLPLLSYGFVAYRAAHPAAAQWPLLEPTPAGLLRHLRGGIFAFYLGHFAPSAEHRAWITHSVLPFLLPGGLALAYAAKRAPAGPRRWFLAALLASATLQVVFFAQYGVPDPAVYALPAVACVLLSIPVLLGRAAARLPHPAAAVPVGLGLLVAGALWLGGAADDRQSDERIEAAIHRRWQAVPFQRGIVFWDDDRYLRLVSYQLLDGDRPGIVVECPSMLTWEPPRRAFERRLGFDPLAGMVLLDESDVRRIPAHVARNSALPVVDFARFVPR